MTIWRSVRRKLSGKTQTVWDLEKLLSKLWPALVVISNGGPLPPVDVAEMFSGREWPFVTIGHNNCELWWPDDELADKYRKLLRTALRCYFVSLANQRVAEIHLGSRIENAEVVRNPFNVSYN